MIKIVEDIHSAKIKVLGVGGGGSNAINRMIEFGVKDVEFIAANTDAQALSNSFASQRLQLGTHLSRGLGVGGDPELGQRAAEEARDAIEEALMNADMVFVTAGMGGGTGTGGAPVVADVARSMGALVVGVVTKPFMFEGSIRAKQAEEGIRRLREHVDTLLIIPNQKLYSIIDESTPAIDAYKVADDVLRQAVQSICDVITSHGMINVDFADVKKVMSGAGEALMGIGSGRGEGRAIFAINEAISSPLLENVTLNGSRGLLVNVTASKDITLFEIKEAMEIIYSNISTDCHVFFGQSFNDALKDEVKITVIATRFGTKSDVNGEILSYRRPDNAWDNSLAPVNSKIKIPAILRKGRGKR